MSKYDNFLDLHKPTAHLSESAEAAILEFSGDLPRAFISLWEDYGFASFHEGLFWLINPKEWESITAEFNMAPNDILPILRSSFGDIVYIDKMQSVWQLTPIFGLNEEVIDNLDDYFNVLMCTENYYKNAFSLKQHRIAKKRLGLINEDECYGFEPLLSLGGSEDVENMVKVKAREHLALIAQTL